MQQVELAIFYIESMQAFGYPGASYTDSLLQQMLQRGVEKGQGSGEWEVINFGVNGYGTRQEAEALPR